MATYELGKIYMTNDPNARLFYKTTQVYPEIALFERVGDGTANTNKTAEFTDAVNPYLVPATAEALEKQRAIFERDVNIHQANLAASQDYLQEFVDAIAAITPEAPVEEPEPEIPPTDPEPDPEPEPEAPVEEPTVDPEPTP